MGSLLYIKKPESFRDVLERTDRNLSLIFGNPQREAKRIGENAFDLHVHSDASPDSKLMKVKVVAKAASRIGLRGVALTDHNLFRDEERHGAVERIFGKEGLIYIPGIELTLKTGMHILLLFSGYNWDSCRRVRSIRDTLIAEDRDLAGILELIHGTLSGIPGIKKAVILAHPSLKEADISGADSLLKPVISAKDPDRWSKAPFNGIDVHARACKEIAKKYRGIPLIAGSDAHIPMMLGTGYTVIDAASREDAIARILEGRTKVRPQYEWWRDFRCIKKYDCSSVPELKKHFDEYCR